MVPRANSNIVQTAANKKMRAQPGRQNCAQTTQAAPEKSARKAGRPVIANGAIQANSSACTKNEKAIQ